MSQNQAQEEIKESPFEQPGTDPALQTSTDFSDPLSKSHDYNHHFSDPTPVTNHPETTSSWICEICDLEETHCKCDDFYYHEELTTTVPPSTTSHNLEHDPSWVCEICDQKQEDCHCDDYFDLEDETFSQESVIQNIESMSLSSPPRESNHSIANNPTSPYPPSSAQANWAPQKKVCTFYLEGHCRYGNNCRDLHPLSIYNPQIPFYQPPQQVCQYFLQGNCRFGNSCNFGHIVMTQK